MLLNKINKAIKESDIKYKRKYTKSILKRFLAVLNLNSTMNESIHVFSHVWAQILNYFIC